MVRWLKISVFSLFISFLCVACSGFGGGGGGGGGAVPLGDGPGGFNPAGGGPIGPSGGGLGGGGGEGGGAGGGNAQPSWQQPDGGIMRPSLIKYVGTVCYRPSDDSECTSTFNATASVKGWQKDQTDPSAQWVSSTLGIGEVDPTGNFRYIYSRRNLPPTPTWFKISFFYADSSGCYSGETPEVTLNTPDSILKPALELKRTTGPECFRVQAPVVNTNAIEEKGMLE